MEGCFRRAGGQDPSVVVDSLVRVILRGCLAAVRLGSCQDFTLTLTLSLKGEGINGLHPKKLSQNANEARGKEAVLSDLLDSRFRGNDDLTASGSFEIDTKWRGNKRKNLGAFQTAAGGHVDVCRPQLDAAVSGSVSVRLGEAIASSRCAGTARSRLQGNVAVLLGREVVALGLQHLEGADYLGAGIRRVDHVV